MGREVISVITIFFKNSKVKHNIFSEAYYGVTSPYLITTDGSARVLAEYIFMLMQSEETIIKIDSIEDYFLNKKSAITIDFITNYLNDLHTKHQKRYEEMFDTILYNRTL